MRKRLTVALAAALIIGWQVRATPEGVAQFVSETKWSQSQAWFGGFSAIEVTDGGDRFLALSDRGHLVAGHLNRRNGEIESITADEAHLVRDSKGEVVKHYRRDTEGLALRDDGRFFISFEGIHRVRGYSAADSRATELPRHADFNQMRRNGSLEALAIDARNRLYTLPESPKDNPRGIPVYRFDNARWSKAFHLSESGGFEAVGADFGPDGMLYVLERKFSGIGFRSRVRRFEIGASGPIREETLLTTAIGEHDNLEGLAVWMDAQGGIRLTMISDDNFQFFQRTEIVEYRLPGQA